MKGEDRITFGWENWFEGEIKATVELMTWLEKKFEVKFSYGDPVHLKPKVINLTISMMKVQKSKQKPSEEDKPGPSS